MDKGLFYLDVSIFLYTGVIYNFSKYCPAVNFYPIFIIVVLTKTEFILALLYNFNIILKDKYLENIHFKHKTELISSFVDKLFKCVFKSC